EMPSSGTTHITATRGAGLGAPSVRAVSSSSSTTRTDAGNYTTWHMTPESGTTSPANGLVRLPDLPDYSMTGGSPSGARCRARTRIILLASGIDRGLKEIGT